MQSVNAGSLVVFKRDVQLCIIGVFPVWAVMFTISGCRSLLQSFEDTFLELVTVENSNITVGILTLSIAVPEIQVFPVWAAILLFPVAVVVAITFFELDLVETPGMPLETNTFAVLLKPVGAFFTPSATRVRKNRSE